MNKTKEKGRRGASEPPINSDRTKNPNSFIVVTRQQRREMSGESRENRKVWNKNKSVNLKPRRGINRTKGEIKKLSRKKIIVLMNGQFSMQEIISTRVKCQIRNKMEGSNLLSFSVSLKSQKLNKSFGVKNTSLLSRMFLVEAK
jgi:hypothetical protein